MSSPKPRRSPKPHERRRDADRTRGLILTAAAAEFAAHGFAGARVGAIATRAGVSPHLIAYYFDGKEGLYQALTQSWREREEGLAEPGTPPSERLRRYALERLHNPDAVRLMAWGGLEYTGPAADPDHAPRAERIRHYTDEIRERQATGRLPADLDPACLTVMLVAAAMATTSIPHVIEGICGADPGSPEFVRHYADQLAALTRHLGLDPT